MGKHKSESGGRTVPLTSARVAKVDRKKMEEVIETRPAIVRRFLWPLLVDEDEDTLRGRDRQHGPTRHSEASATPYVRALCAALNIGLL
jgi:hypothetical protein